MKHPTFPPGLPSRDGSDGKKGKARVRAYTDRGDRGLSCVHLRLTSTFFNTKPGK